MRLCLFALFLVVRSFALTIEGPTVAVCGGQNVYRILGPTPVTYCWRLEWKGAQGEAEPWEGDDNEPVLNLVFAGDPGPHFLQLVAANSARSNRIEIEAMEPGTPGLGAKTPSVSAVSGPLVPTLSAAELLGSSGAPPPREGVPGLPQAPAANQVRADGPAVVSPNADGILDLTAAPVPQDPDPLPNPFRVRYRPRMQVREISLQIGLILVGRHPEDASAVINGKLYSPGDLFEGLPIASITPDTIEFRQDKLLLRVPVEDRPVTLRLLR